MCKTRFRKTMFCALYVSCVGSSHSLCAHALKGTLIVTAVTDFCSVSVLCTTRSSVRNDTGDVAERTYIGRDVEYNRQT